MAQGLTQEEGEPNDKEPKFNWLPFGFFSESFGLGLGVGGIYSHTPQRDSAVLGAVTVGTSGSYNVALGGTQLQSKSFPRLFFYPVAVLARYFNQDLYVGSNNEGFEGQRAGANDSDPDNLIEATQWDNWIDLEFRYLLPLGHGRKEPLINTYTVKDGILQRGATGGSSWNPLESGRTFIIVKPAYRKQTLENDDLNVPLETLNVELALKWDNRDYPNNPSKGSYMRYGVQQDFSDEDDLGGWTALFAEGQQLFNFSPNREATQRVLALTYWTAYVPTWETDADGTVTKRPPQFEGATLGGLYRMRAYEGSRFHDKAAMYYSAEYRVIPRWQPLRNLSFLDWAEIRYWQFAIFGEMGQVAEEWSLSELHDDLRWSAGLSLRGMFYQAVCRLDFAYGEEGGRVVAMYGHPF